MKKLILSVVSLLTLTSCANSQGDVFGRKADTGALLGGMAGAIIGAYNGNVAKGALIGAGAGLAAGAVADANDARQPQLPSPPPPSPEIHSSDIVVKEAPMVIVETPVIIDERIWVGNDVWIYSYHGFRGPNGHIRYESRIPFHRKFIRGGIGYRR